MVSITKKQIGNEVYYYLGYTYRSNGKVNKVEKYLGKEIPKDIEKLKKEFIFEIYKEKWFKIFDNIKKNYRKDQNLMPSSAKEKELSSFMIKFTYDTQKIEGSKLTLKDTANLLERGISPKERPIRDIKEAEAHKKVFYEMLKYDKDLSMQIVLYWHKKLFEESDKEIAGKIREHGVQISMSKFMPPSPVELQTLLREFFDWYNQNKNKIVPVELAALVHLKFVSIHPFSDGNGRISRLMMNFVLHKCGFPMLDIPYAKRTGYYNALERSQIKNEEHIFVQWFFKKFIESNKRFC
jgi:Fic family protein